MFSSLAFLGLTMVCGFVSAKELKECQKHEIKTGDIQEAWLASKAVYEKSLKIGDIIDGTNFVVKKIFEKPVDKKYLLNPNAKTQETVTALVAENNNKLVISFRGVDGIKQLTDVIMTSLSKLGGSKIQLKGHFVKVNTYFYAAFQTLYSSIKKYTEQPNKQYLITGFSLGGAMADLLAAVDLSSDNNIFKHDSSSLITFGAPRVGNPSYAKLHDELLSSYRKIRVINGNDPIPMLPFFPFYMHESREMWMTGSSQKHWKYCGKFDSVGCRLTSWFPSFDDHEIARYEDRVMNLPQIFKDKLKRDHSSWESVYMTSCLNDY